MMNSNLFVAKLSYDTKENTLQDLFAQAGKVVSVRIAQDKSSGQSKGFGFIEMGSPEEAAKAIELFNGKDVDGRTIVVTEAKAKEERPRGGGFGGSGGDRRGGFAGGGGTRDGGGRRSTPGRQGRY